MEETCIDKMDNDKKIYGIIGYPVAHSLSPKMQNAALRRLGINAQYFAFEVKPKDLKNAIQGVKGRGMTGVNITIPHKEAVIKYLDEVSREAELIGAVNTIVNKNGKLFGYNTDAHGFIKSLKEDLKFSPKAKAIFVIGAGGAAKAVVFGLAIEGAKRIVLTDMIDEKALDLACEVELRTGCECIAIEIHSTGAAEMILNSQLLVNATPIGMKAGDPAVINPEVLHKGLCVFDLVYNRETKLLKAAARKGIRAVGGLNMLLYQGAKAFELWTGKKAPVEVMRKALAKKLR